MKTLFQILIAALISGMAGCSQPDNQIETVVTFQTPYGEMIAVLYNETPRHKANFIKLAKEGFYDSLLFHRVIQGFMIQGGDPDSRKAQPGQPLGTGGPGYTVEAEFNPDLFHRRGALAAARLGNNQNPSKASSGSQFYIVQGSIIGEEDIENLKINHEKLNEGFQMISGDPQNKPLMDSLMFIYSSGDMAAYQKKVISMIPRIEKQTGLKLTKDISPEKIEAYTTVGGAPHLDGDYTVFGIVISGLQVIDNIAAVSVDGNNRPLQDVRMTVTVEDMPRSEIKKKYGYTFPDKKN
jgi:peptidyl-prolyl cis-trans isomerase B (cyclophilin B)